MTERARDRGDDGLRPPPCATLHTDKS